MDTLRKASKKLFKAPRQHQLVLLVLVVLAFSAIAVNAEDLEAPLASSHTIAVDTGEFIIQINSWLEVAFPIIAIGVGISGAFAIALFIGRMIVDAFRGNI